MGVRTKIILQFLGIAGAALAVLAVQRSAETPREFHGTLHFPVIFIGGGRTDTALSTSRGSFRLFFSKQANWMPQLPRLAGKRVVVVGHARVARGVERVRYNAIDVIELRGPDDQERPKMHCTGTSCVLKPAARYTTERTALAGPANKGAQGSKQNRDIQLKGHVFEVIQVELQFALRVFDR